MSRTIDADALIDILESRAKMADGIMVGRTFLHVARIIKSMPSLTLNDLRDAIYDDAVVHGLWESTDYTVQNFIDEQERAFNPFDKTDEVLRSWAMEPIRKEVDELEMASESEEEYAEELADVIIASLSVAGKLGIDIDAAVRRKMEINKARPWKHGKEDITKI